MMMIKVIPLMTAVLLSVNALSANMELERSQMEADLENRIRPNVDAIIGQGRYSLDLNIILGIKKADAPPKVDGLDNMVEKAGEIQKKCTAMLDEFKTPTAQIKAAPASLPGLPAMQSSVPSLKAASASPMQETVNSMMAMMAMSKCQEQFARLTKPVAPVATQAADELYIEKIKISLIVDEEVNEVSLEMAKAQIMSKANFDGGRGDLLDITEFDFDATAPLQSGFIPSLSTLYEEQPVLFWVLFALFLISIIAIIVRGKKQDMSALAKMNIQGESVKPKFTEATAKATELESRSKAVEIINDLVRRKMYSSDIWDTISNDKPEFVNECKAAVFHVRGRAGVSQLFGKPSDAEFIEISDASEEMAMTDAATLLSELLSLTNLVAESGEEYKNNPFEFLSSMTIDDIMQVLKDMRPNEQAILMTQVEPKASGKLLKAMSPGERGDLLVRISRSTEINPSELLAIAETAAIAAKQQPKLKNIASSGVDITGDILDGLGESDQKEALQSIRAKNPATYIEVRENLILWQDLPRIPVKVLGQILLEFEPEQIRSALASTEDSFREYVLGALTTRFRARVNAESDSNENNGEFLGSQSKINILKAIRKGVVDGMLNRGDMEPLSINSADSRIAAS